MCGYCVDVCFLLIVFLKLEMENTSPFRIYSLLAALSSLPEVGLLPSKGDLH